MMKRSQISSTPTSSTPSSSPSSKSSSDSVETDIDELAASADELGKLTRGAAMVPPGTEVMVTWGEEKFSPVQYSSCGVGPFSVTLKTRPDETVAECAARGMRILEEVARADFERKMKSFLQRVREAAASAR